MDGTSDIGQMYQQELQRRGVPMTPDNMRRLVEQSRMNTSQGAPDLISGLHVQGADPSAASDAKVPQPPPLASPSPQVQLPASSPPSVSTMNGSDQLPMPPPMSPGVSPQSIATSVNGGAPPSTSVVGDPEGTVPQPRLDGGPSIVEMALSALGIGGAALGGNKIIGGGRQGIGKPAPQSTMPPRPGGDFNSGAQSPTQARVLDAVAPKPPPTGMDAWSAESKAVESGPQGEVRTSPEVGKAMKQEDFAHTPGRVDPVVEAKTRARAKAKVRVRL